MFDILVKYLQDAGYHGAAGVLIFLSGILMIVAAVKIDDYVYIGAPVTNINWRQEFKYHNKVVAGVSGI